jgi:lactoylglutathione lyase
LSHRTMGGSQTFYIRTSGLEDLYKHAQAQGLLIAMSWKTTFYGANEFAIEDPNGYVLVFSESLVPEPEAG